MRHELIDNPGDLHCQSDRCWGEVPMYVYIDNADSTVCGNCDNVIETYEGEEPDRSDPDPDFHNSNAWDITTAGR